MSKKRRVFDIDLPEDEPARETKSAVETFPAGKVSNNETKRRGPMAAAITETAESVKDRGAVEAKIRQENDALAHEHVRLKRLGLITDLIPLNDIVIHKLSRDRTQKPDFELRELKTSIESIGLSNPIRVEPRDDGKYELIQGFRRLAAFKELRDDHPDDDTFKTIPAAIFARGETLETLYRRMVDENLVRKDISYAEMAKLAITYADDPDTEETDAEKAVGVLFKSASYQKRSYIRSFIKFVDLLWKDLEFAEEIPRSLGLAISHAVEEIPGTVSAIQSELKDWDNRSVADELEVLRRVVGGEEAEERAAKRKSAKPGVAVPVPSVASKAKTSFQMRRRQGQAKCVAGAGRLEIRMDRDFSAIDRRKLEMAVQSLLDHLD
ncbi:MAG: ParB N-terminal domain-containing protein [Pseudomonadota bacterium]